MEIVLVNNQEFIESWKWLIDHLSIDKTYIDDHKYFLEHKYLNFPNHTICIDTDKNASIYFARLYLVSQVAPVSDYLEHIKSDVIDFDLKYFNENLDNDIAQIINAQETQNNHNSFRNSLSEHLIHWICLASIIKGANFQDFSIIKPNIKSEDHGPDGLACLVNNNEFTIKLVSIKNSINPPQSLISSTSIRKKSGSANDPKKILDEFYEFRNQNKGFHRLDDNLNILLQSLGHSIQSNLRQSLLRNSCEFNAAVVANEKYANSNLFEGFSNIIDDPNKCIGIYLGSNEWKIFSNNVQIEIKYILNSSGIKY
jgi:hypothetical protein